MSGHRDVLPPNAGKGRKRGVPNKTTSTMREAIAKIVDQNMPRMQEWLDTIAKRNPDKAADLIVRLLEYTTPKLMRAELRQIEPESRPVILGISFQDGGPGLPRTSLHRIDDSDA